ncbi:unnamed protein product [Rhizophagus irregularis]|uniref:Uncharacterized protein n=1 Tax=Rhizophagus irregularis TaxID=588596 RepID=A0A915YQ13_9GLOM|nr:unnamed protein product [Rhizophagus irregularis]CAB5193022.1 unnamed protein product [Rhizophagus irregularis]CAB5305307.1 unnamed protein product [Rhizophagus irregularis]CAB5366244.1 unnamed protein product [Rhizophagus irregularis]
MKLNFILAILLSLVVISLAAPTKTIEERDYISSRTVEKRDEKPICPTVTPPGEPSCESNPYFTFFSVLLDLIDF